MAQLVIWGSASGLLHLYDLACHFNFVTRSSIPAWADRNYMWLQINWLFVTWACLTHTIVHWRGCLRYKKSTVAFTPVNFFLSNVIISMVTVDSILRNDNKDIWDCLAVTRSGASSSDSHSTIIP
ncbi:hypothetical protein B0O99DRAFT_49848 [Bisporella sp. PMI_857]|nr:hypothetical protein B0O99DRAFT_49848 [Bisporella sp. PMI_857]